MDFETPLTSLVWITSIVSIIVTYIVTYMMIPNLGDGTLWWKLASIISCGTLAGAIIPELVKVFTSTKSSPREGSRQIGAGRRSFAGDLVGIRGRQFLGLLAGTQHGRAHGHWAITSAWARRWRTRCSLRPSSRLAWSRSASWAWARSRSPSIPTGRLPTMLNPSTSCR